MSDPGNPKIGTAAFAVAIAVITAWLALLTRLVFHIDATEVEWARLLAILGSLEAVAFAAAGAIFGTTIQKQRVQDAHKRADKAEGRAADAERTAAAKSEAAANGRALASAVKARAAKKPGAGLERVSAVPGTAIPDDLVELANQLFPE